MGRKNDYYNHLVSHQCSDHVTRPDALGRTLRTRRMLRVPPTE